MTDFIKRYVYDVTRRLPEKQRDDVAKELNSEIEEMVLDRARGKKPTKKHINDVLMQLGNPAKLADEYQERKRFIIGLLYYDSYISLLKLLLAIVLPVIIFFTFTARISTVNEQLIWSVMHAFGAGLEVAVHIFFWLTVSFILVERKLHVKDIETEMWTPDQLPALPATQRISKTDALVGFTWSAIAVAASALQFPLLHQMVNGDSPQFFAPDMWPFWTVGLFIISVVSLGAEIMKLIVGGWTRAMVAVIATVNILVISYFVSLIMFVKPVINPEFSRVVGETIGSSNVATIGHQAVIIFVVSVVAISVYEVIDATRRYYQANGKEAQND